MSEYTSLRSPGIGESAVFLLVAVFGENHTSTRDFPSASVVGPKARRLESRWALPLIAIVGGGPYQRPVGSLHRQGNTLRLLIGGQALPEVEIDLGNMRIVDDDDVVRLRAQTGLGPVGASGHHGLRDTAFDIHRKLVVADRGRVVEHAILDGIR